MAKVRKITAAQTSLTWQKQHQEAMFRASKHHATGTYHGRAMHGMKLLKQNNKSPLLTISQKGSEDTMAPM